MRIATVVCVALVTAPILGAAAEPEGAAWSTRVWRSSDGLPDPSLTGVAQTGDGFLWLATRRHLSRFDGVRFDSFPAGDVLPVAATIRLLQPARDGGAWVVSSQDAVLHLDGRGAPRTVKGPSATDRTEALLEDDDRALWLAYRDGAVGRLRGGVERRFGVADGLAAGSVCALAKDRQGRVWFAHSRRVGIFDGTRFVTRNTVGAAFTRLTRAADGGMWIVSGHQIFKHDGADRLELRGELPAEHARARVVVVLEARDGGLWIGTRHDGLFRYGGSSLESVPVSDSSIRDLFEDREGNLWVGTTGGGLNRVQPRAVEVEGAATGLASRLVQSIAEDARGDLWAATQNGLLLRRTKDGWGARTR